MIKSLTNDNEDRGAWSDLFRDGKAKWTLLLNLGVGLHALDVFIINTIMPTVIADIGGLSFYTWASMIYMVGSIVGAAAGHHLRVRFGKRNGYLWGGLVVLIGTIGCALSRRYVHDACRSICKRFGWRIRHRSNPSPGPRLF